MEHALKHARRMIDEANGKGGKDATIPSVADMQIVLSSLEANRLTPSGEPFSEDTCKDLESRFQKLRQGAAGAENVLDSKELKPVIDFTCKYNEHETSTGWDYLNAAPIKFYRDGCYCESKSGVGCPLQYGDTPNYCRFGCERRAVLSSFQSIFCDKHTFLFLSAHFGFASTEKKSIPGASVTPSGLCWFWSDPLHPEYGYERSVSYPY